MLLLDRLGNWLDKKFNYPTKVEIYRRQKSDLIEYFKIPTYESGRRSFIKTLAGHYFASTNLISGRAEYIYIYRRKPRGYVRRASLHQDCWPYSNIYWNRDSEFTICQEALTALFGDERPQEFYFKNSLIWSTFFFLNIGEVA